MKRKEGVVVRKRLIIEMGMGVDQHGQEPTVAAARAVRNAIAHNALPGVWEVAGLSDHDQMIVEVQVAVPYPNKFRKQKY
jgi:uncharacterized protein (TIGR02058 family)